VVIAGIVSVDNAITSISLNGNALPVSGNPVFNQPFGTATFGIGSGSQALLLTGVNTFRFVAINDPGPTGNPQGLRVALSGTATVIPEPSMTVALIATGMALILFRRPCRPVID
jgi:hypothetical protein